MPTIGARFTPDLLSDLPTSGNLFAILETTQAEVVTDRFSIGGLNAGEPVRTSGFLASWSQTQFRIGDVNIASPVDGLPLMFPEIAFWRDVQIFTGAMPAFLNAPGLAIGLEPARPVDRWQATVEGIGSGGRLAGPRDMATPPPIARLDSWGSANVLLSGPIKPALGVVVGGSWSQNSIFDRAEHFSRRERVRSVFAHVIHTPAIGKELRVLAWLQQARTPGATDAAVHVQSTLERKTKGSRGWKIYGGFTRRGRSPIESTGSMIAERLIDGPISTLARDRESRESRWSLGARFSPLVGRQSLHAAFEIERLGARATPFSGLIGELVDSVPTRVWIYEARGIDSVRGARNVTGSVSDRVALGSNASIDGWLRLESIRGSARGSVTDISWFSVLPGLNFRWGFGTPLHLAMISGYRRSGNALLLDLLAYGDPAGAGADVRRWTGSLDDSGMLIGRVGPGTRGESGFSTIDPDLSRPVTDEFSIGLESLPRPTLRFAVRGIARRQSAVANVVNVGVPSSAYSTFTISDPNVDLVGDADDHELVVFNRLPASFGADRYLLTNPRVDAATMGAFVISAQSSTDRLFLLIGATASASVGPAGHRGFRAVENDPDVAGELFTNPNAETFARGRLFNDRAYTIKWTTIYRFPADVRLGVIARYQDGQPFSRLVVVDGLNQGREAIRAFANGRSRFAFTGTVDARLQKGFTIGRARLDAILDVYNALGMKKEVEERVVTGARYRDTTALQPPRSFHVGVRFSFSRP